MNAPSHKRQTQRSSLAANQSTHRLPGWLIADLRSDHAGETGAVMIYRGILAVTRNAEVASFADHHLHTESQHLVIIEQMLERQHWTLLLPVWRVMGWLTGALPALFGANAVYGTIVAVERFVDIHYQEQIDRLSPQGRFADIRRQLVACQQDERDHRDEARKLMTKKRGLALILWQQIVGLGSQLAVCLARRI